MNITTITIDAHGHVTVHNVNGLFQAVRLLVPQDAPGLGDFEAAARLHLGEEHDCAVQGLLGDFWGTPQHPHDPRDVARDFEALTRNLLAASPCTFDLSAIDWHGFATSLIEEIRDIWGGGADVDCTCPDRVHAPTRLSVAG